MISHRQKLAILIDCGLRRQQQPFGIDGLLMQAAQSGVLFGMSKGVCQHLRNRLITQAVGWFDGHRSLNPAAEFTCRNRQKAIGINLKGHLNPGRTGHHWRNPAELKSPERSTVGDQFALTLNDMHGHGGLAILERRKFLSTCRRDGRIARENSLDKTTHGLETEGQRNHIE